MDTLVAKAAERRRRRHSEEFKRQVVEACLQPGVSLAAIALANGLNANYLRRWVREHRETGERRGPLGEAVGEGTSAVIPVTITAAPPADLPLLEIRLDVRRGGTTVQMAWPVESAASLGPCLRELLR